MVTLNEGMRRVRVFAGRFLRGIEIGRRSAAIVNWLLEALEHLKMHRAFVVSLCASYSTIDYHNKIAMFSLQDIFLLIALQSHNRHRTHKRKLKRNDNVE